MKLGNLLKNMGADVASLERSRYSRAQREGEKLEAMLREVMPPSEAAMIASRYIAKTPKPEKSEPFIMLSPAQNFAVNEWLHAHSKRKDEAKRLWSLLFTAVHPNTGEIMLTRSEISQRLQVKPENVSRIMTELASINAILREKRGREVVYFMSNHIATHLPTGERLNEARTKTPKLRLVQPAERSEREALEAAGQMRLLD